MSNNKTKTYGDLVVTLTSAFASRWNDLGSGAKRNGAFWHPKAQGQLRGLGSVVVPHWDEINDAWAVLLVGDDPSQRPEGKGPAVAPPTDYKPIWNDRGSGARRNVSTWRPVAPPGYTAVGDVAWPDHGKPDLDQIWCLRNDLIMDGVFNQDATWNDAESGAADDGSFWEITPRPNTSLEGYIPILAGTFRGNRSHGSPDSSLARVPKLFAPNQEKELSDEHPKITPDNIPNTGKTFTEIVQSSVTLPFTSFFEPSDRSCLDNINDPFCSVRKYVTWTVLDKQTNNGLSPVKKTISYKTGVIKNTTTTMGHTVGITITTEGEFMLAKWSVSLSYQFSYSQATSLTTTEEKTESTEVTISPKVHRLQWGRRVSIKGERADGTLIGGELIYATDEGTVDEIPIKG